MAKLTTDAMKWDAFIGWASKLYAHPAFDERERNYKIEIAENVARLRDGLRAGAEDWLPLLKAAFGKPNNLTDWRANDKFSKWAVADPAAAAQSLLALWNDAQDPGTAVRTFLDLAPKDAVSGAQLSVFSFFLMGEDPHLFAFYRARVIEDGCRLTGYPTPPKYLDRGARYEHFLSFLDRVLEEAASRGLKLRDRLDAQSLTWWIVQGEPPEDWQDAEREAFLEYRQGKDALPAEKETPLTEVRSSDLLTLVDRFRRESPYPNEKDPAQLRAREEFASYITPEALETPEWDKIQLLYSSNKYGFTGVMPELNRYINSADEDGLIKLRNAIAHLLYGKGDLAKRLDDVIEGAHRIPGLGEAVATKLLALSQPTEILPAYVTEGKAGKARLMQLLPGGLKPPAPGTRGERAVAANKALRDTLRPYFQDDMWGMGRFLFWLLNKGAETPVPEASLRDLADDLLLSEVWLTDVLSLLRDRKQIIFYGPPGTGKTYIARKIMEFLAKDESRRAVVQFHPSYSYEDFVQGYRPIAREDGSLSYALKPGPLLRLATRARDSAGEHVLLIDEINRGNLPKILGELLYLLEYRDDEIDLMYAEGTSRFAMPENLLVIGTMNTADRSIGLIDAALRRRFHFIALFPNEEPLVGLLDRWFQRFNPSMAHVGELVDRLNARLRQQFGPHLQVGPSHFFKRDLDEALLRRIWKHDVMPFLEDQLFSHENELAAFTIEKLMGQADADDSTEGASDLEPDAPDAD